VQDVFEVADLAETGAIGPAEGVARIRAAESTAPPYAGYAQILGYVGVAAGLAMTLGGSLLDVLVASVLGAVIAGVQVATARLPAAYQSLVVLTCAFVVSAAVFLLSRTGLDVGTLAPLAAPLVTFLPGALLTTAAIDLATRQMIAGSARLAAGGMQLVLLALGITGGAALVGVPATEVGASAAQPLGWAGPWLGVFVYGVGVVFTYCARRTALPWILLVLVVAYAGQVLGGLVFGGVFSAFVGALVMTPVAMFASTRPTGPPVLVGFLPGFWLLVPGALGLVGVTSFLDNDAQALTTVINAGTTMVAISLGVLAGIALGTAIGKRAGVSMGRL
jgi:Putative threonine/serine exporter